jgi:hypothetical protein
MEAAELSALLSLPGMESAPLQSSTNSIFILHVYSFLNPFFPFKFHLDLQTGRMYREHKHREK